MEKEEINLNNRDGAFPKSQEGNSCPQLKESGRKKPLRDKGERDPLFAVSTPTVHV